MASYYRDSERDGLPSIQRKINIESSRRITTLDDGDYRLRSLSPSGITYGTDPIYHPRPPSPSQRASDAQIKTLREELAKKDLLIQQLNSMEAIPKVTVRSQGDFYRNETMYYGDRHALETARGELASVKVKNEKLSQQVEELKIELETKELSLREVKSLYETSKENEARLSALLESHTRQIHDLEGKAGSFETAVSRGEFTVSSLQKQLRENQEKILELETRLRKHLDEKETAEMRCHSVEKKMEDLLNQLSGLLHIDTTGFTGYSLNTEDIMKKMTDLVQENAMLKGKIVTMTEMLSSTELETKASRETIMRLVSEVGKEQKVTTRYTSEIENLRMERDTAVSDRRALEREVDVMRERLEASHRSMEAIRGELSLKESRLCSLDEELRSHSLNVRSAHSHLSGFREQIVSLLSTPDDYGNLSEEDIKCRITDIVHQNREYRLKIESQEDRLRTLSEQLESQYELHKTAAQRARQGETAISELESRLRSAEGELAAGDVLRDGFKNDKTKYMKLLQDLVCVLKVDRISADLGLDMTIDAILARADQLVKMEKDTIADKSTHIYNLQRKIKSLKEQLESKDLHIDLLRKKLSSLEEKILGKTEIERERDTESFKVKKMEKLAQKYKLTIQDLREEITNLKAQLLGSSELKMRTIEQRKEIEDLVVQVQELEEQRSKQAHKISKLKGNINDQESELREKRVVADNAVSALSSELRTTKTALQTIQNREKQLLDFRMVVARMLGLDLTTLAIPDYEIITRLEKLIQAHHNHAFTTISMEEALADMEDGFLSGLEDSLKMRNDENVQIRRARDRARRKAARARARSASPSRRDRRVY